MESIFTDKFGFLFYKEKIQFSNGVIEPLDNFEDISNFIEKRINKDGFVYPPIVNDYSRTIDIIDDELQVNERIIPKTKRPAILHKIPASHRIDISEPIVKEDPQNGDGFFIMNLLSFIFATRLHFSGWRIYGKIPIHAITNDFHISHLQLEEFIDESYHFWKMCSNRNKKLLSNLLYMQTKVPIYHWDWERFLISYMVLDGCYKIIKQTQKLKCNRHKDRIETILKYFDMKIDVQRIGDIVKLRNELFHETLWDGGLPGQGSNFASAAARDLRNLNRRIICAILGHSGEYVKSAWWSLDQFAW